MTRLNGMGMFMEPIGFPPVPIIPTWSWVWKYMLDGRPEKKRVTNYTQNKVFIKQVKHRTLETQCN